jgi:hypothetical protein
VFLIVVHSQDENGGLGILRLEPPDSFYAAHLGHTNFGDDYVRLELMGQINRFQIVASLTNYEVRFSLEELPDALPDHVLVVDKKYCGLFHLNVFLHHGRKYKLRSAAGEALKGSMCDAERFIVINLLAHDYPLLA